jgi:putative flippase GtrA
MATRSSSSAELLAAFLGRPWVKRLGRFLMAAAAVQGVYTAGMAVGLLLLDAPRQAVLLVAFLLSLIVHFSLNRQWVFNPRRHEPHAGGHHHAYRLGLSGHGGRYVIVAAAAYGITALSLAVLPGLLGLAPFLIWLATSGTIGVLNFFLLGRLVFR